MTVGFGRFQRCSPRGRTQGQQACRARWHSPHLTSLRLASMSPAVTAMRTRAIFASKSATKRANRLHTHVATAREVDQTQMSDDSLCATEDCCSARGSHLGPRSPRSASSRACPWPQAPASRPSTPGSRGRGQLAGRQRERLRCVNQARSRLAREVDGPRGRWRAARRLPSRRQRQGVSASPAGQQSGAARRCEPVQRPGLGGRQQRGHTRRSPCCSAALRPGAASAEMAASAESLAIAAAARISANSADRTALATTPLAACAAVRRSRSVSKPRCCVWQRGKTLAAAARIAGAALAAAAVAGAEVTPTPTPHRRTLGAGAILAVGEGGLGVPATPQGRHALCGNCPASATAGPASCRCEAQST